MKPRLLLLTCALAALAATAQAENMQKYLVHRSGLTLARGTAGKAVIQNTAPPKLLTFDGQDDGTYCIRLASGTTTYTLGINTANDWDTYFLATRTGERMRYKIEQASGGYVRLRNVHTNKYLGTNSILTGSPTYSDKPMSHGDMTLWYLADTPGDFPADETLSYSIHPQAARQQVEGWGASLCWWANMCGRWNEESIDRLVDWMVSPRGLNWNIFRYNIGGGDDPLNRNCEPHHMGKGKGLRAEMEGFQDEPGGPYHWERDAAQRRIMLKIKERRPDAVFEAFSNSAPWWMTESGCCAGNKSALKDNLKPEYYEAFARYLVDVCHHYKEEYGIEFKTLEPFNEPVTPYWYAGGTQEGCHFSTEEQVRFLRILKPMLDASGLRTVISASDETSTAQSVRDLQHYIGSDAMPLIGQWNAHTYLATDRSRSQTGTLARAAGKTLWMSETGEGGNGLSGNLNLCRRLFSDMHYMLPSAWLDWQYVEEGNDQWCMVRADFANAASATRVPNYYVRQQVTRFIRQGYTMVSALSDNALAALSPGRDTLVTVLLNTGLQPVTHDITLPGVSTRGTVKAFSTSENGHMRATTGNYKPDNDGLLTVRLPGLTVLTIIMPVTLETSPQQVEDGGTYLIVPQSNCNMALSSAGGIPALARADMHDPAQQWTLHTDADGRYTLLDGLGRTITTASGDGTLSADTPSADALTLAAVPAEDYFHTLATPSGTVLALQGGRLTAGTAVTAEPYGDMAAADTRHWQLIRLTPPQGSGLGADGTTTSTADTQYYDLSGRRLPTPAPGINICSSPDRTVKRTFAPEP